ncbi:helicase [Nitrincola tapanii]|uniref:Helicase n=1 Tax=Nitrincola tapanii TaxID=1708751 RepID=A0A5A9VYQ6_9GAMM|nr:helicase [Nitrincola tapanii]
MNPGDKVRLIASPERIGIMGNEFEGSERRRRVLVTFLDGSEQFCLLGALEKMPSGPQSPYEMLLNGRFGGARHLRCAVTYYRLSGRLANLIYSLNTTNTQFLAYQFKPVLKFLDSPSGGILIADEVGLGKTVEAGLIWTELKARQDARRLLVICPAMLKEKWQSELADRFGVNAQIVDAAELLKYLQHAKEKPHDSFALIAGIQGVRPPKNWSDKDKKSASARLASFIEDAQLEEALLDMVIIDEAHILKNQATASYEIAKLLRQITHSMVMLSATPIQLHNRELFNLINLLDSDAFPYEQSFDRLIRENQPLVKLRDMLLRKGVGLNAFINEIKRIRNNQIFSGNEQLAYFQENPPREEYLNTPAGRAEIADQLDRINPLGNIVTRTRKQDVHENRVERLAKVIKARMTEAELSFYNAVTDKVRRFCHELSVSEGFMLTIPQRQISSCMVAACRGWLNRFSSEELEEISYELDESNEIIADDAQGKMGTLLHELVSITRTISNERALYEGDSKYNELLVNLKKYWRDYPDKKVVLFSFYRNTLHYLSERLSKDGINSVVVHGGMDKHAAIAEFSDPDGPQILLSSEVAAEGVDLQFSSLIINYDLPWNPAKIEQRIGRIDRIGQQEKKILIWNFVYENTIDDRVYERLLQRLETFSQALGSMGEVLGRQIRKLGYELLSHDLTPEQEAKQIEGVQIAIANNAMQQEKLEQDAASLIAHGDFIQNKVRAARELGRYIRGEDLYAFVSDYLKRNYPGTRLISDDINPLKVRVELSIQGRLDFSEYLEKNHLRNQTNILNDRPPKLFFENQYSARIKGEERIAQDHPLVRFVTEKYRISGVINAFQPVSALYWKRSAVADSVLPGDYIYTVFRWSVSGVRVIERLVYLLQRISDGILIEGDEAETVVNAAALYGSDWDGAGGALTLDVIADLYENCLEHLHNEFNRFAEVNKRENSDRIQLMTNLLSHRLDEKRKNVDERIEKYKFSGDPKKLKMIPLEKGRFHKEEGRIRVRIEELKTKSKVSWQENLVSSGVIRIA